MLRCGPSPGLSRRPRIAESEGFFRASLSRYRRRYGEPLLEARATAPASLAGRLLGYVSLQDDGEARGWTPAHAYVDDVAVEPEFHGLRVARALLAAAGACGVARARAKVALDVNGANAPARALYEQLGFRFGPLEHPSWLDWDGGYEGDADAAKLAALLPPNADISELA